MTIPPYHRGSGDPRIEAFERVRRAFRWTIVGSAAGAAAIFGVVAHQIPGRSTSSPSTVGASTAGSAITASTGVGSTGGTGNTGTGNTGTGNTGNTGPGAAVSVPTAPTPAQRAPAAVSGGTGW